MTWLHETFWRKEGILLDFPSKASSSESSASVDSPPQSHSKAKALSSPSGDEKATCRSMPRESLSSSIADDKQSHSVQKASSLPLVAEEVSSPFHFYALQKQGQTIATICHDQEADDALFLAICGAITVTTKQVAKADENLPCFVLAGSEAHLKQYITKSNAIGALANHPNVQYFASLTEMKKRSDEKKKLWQVLKPLR